MSLKPEIIDLDDYVAPKKSKTRSLVNRVEEEQYILHPMWEHLDPTPDVHSLFRAFNTNFFKGKLGSVRLEWTKEMKSCAAVCYKVREKLIIRLSEPLLKLRSRKDLIETLLHEMIHAYCFTMNVRESNGGHGYVFRKIADSINKATGTEITVYHSFHDVIDIYKTHIWRCNGMCQNREPFYGYFKRKSNRNPGTNDFWWAVHQSSCGGLFLKVRGPETIDVEDINCNTRQPTPATKTGIKTEKKWKPIDSDIMISKFEVETINLDSDDEDDFKSNAGKKWSQERTEEARNIKIKQEIVDESLEFIAIEDIEILDHNYDDDLNEWAVVEEHTSVINNLFENNRFLSSNNRANNVTCPICQNSFHREFLGEHLDGCSGLTVQIQPKRNKHWISIPTDGTKKSSKFTHREEKEQLRTMGYSVDDINKAYNDSSRSQDNSLKASSNIVSPQAECPVCYNKVPADTINQHLDGCLY